MIVNLTVWESMEALRAYVFKSEHVEFLRRRREWFEAPDGPYLALWWIPEDTIPTVEEAVAKLAELGETGPTASVFTFAKLPEPTAS
jgi:hypothetical protein